MKRINRNTVFDCSVIDMSKITSKVGNITVVENEKNIPFNVQRVYYLYDVPGGESRGGHAHYELEQYIVAAGGSFDVVLDDGVNRRRISLNRPNLALHVVPGLWREINSFSSGAICLVLASHLYDEKDYIRNIEDFIKYKLC
jgi:hypothetical protein